MQNKYHKGEEGLYTIYAPLEINGVKLEQAEVPFYINEEDFQQVDSLSGYWRADFANGSGSLPFILGTCNNDPVHLEHWIFMGRRGQMPGAVVIDHDNRKTIDNRWVNLRLVPPALHNENKRIDKSEKPPYDAHGLTRQGVTALQGTDQHYAFVGSVFLGSYSAHDTLGMNLEFNLAQSLLFNELSRKQLYEHLLTTNMSQVSDASLDIHLRNVLDKLNWTPTFID